VAYDTSDRRLVLISRFAAKSLPLPIGEVIISGVSKPEPNCQGQFSPKMLREKW
jgi:hypothetical protein